jgi:hypothetical protein
VNVTSNLPIVSALVCAMLLPAHARAVAPVQEHAVSVEIDTTGLSTLSEETAEHLSTVVDEALRKAGMRSAADASSHLRIEVKFSGKSKVNFVFVAEGSTDGATLADARAGGTCDKCVSNDVVEKVNAALPGVLDALREELDKAAEPPPPTPVTTDRDAPTSAADTTKSRRQLHTLGKAGIGVGVVGILALGGGIWMAVRDTKYKERDDAQREGGYDTRDGGIATAAIGGAALVGGLAMLLVDLGVGKRGATKRGAAAVLPSRGGAAVVFGMKF